MRQRTLSALCATLRTRVIGVLPHAMTVQARAAEPAQRLTVVRDAETETLLHNIADPLFRAAGLNPGLVRVIVVRDRAINGFVSTGNRMSINTARAGAGRHDRPRVRSYRAWPESRRARAALELMRQHGICGLWFGKQAAGARLCGIDAQSSKAARA